MGFKIAIDDLGEGFSSLRLWSELRPEFIKIDMHLCRVWTGTRSSCSFLKSIQHIAESCGTNVIAEGVRNGKPEVCALVKDIGIALGQGYFHRAAQPTPPLLASNRDCQHHQLGQHPSSASNCISGSQK